MELLDSLPGHAGEASVDTLAGERAPIRHRPGRNTGAHDIIAPLARHTAH